MGGSAGFFDRERNGRMLEEDDDASDSRVGWAKPTREEDVEREETESGPAKREEEKNILRAGLGPKR